MDGSRHLAGRPAEHLDLLLGGEAHGFGIDPIHGEVGNSQSQGRDGGVESARRRQPDEGEFGASVRPVHVLFGAAVLQRAERVGGGLRHATRRAAREDEPEDRVVPAEVRDRGWVVTAGDGGVEPQVIGLDREAGGRGAASRVGDQRIQLGGSRVGHATQRHRARAEAQQGEVDDPFERGRQVDADEGSGCHTRPVEARRDREHRGPQLREGELPARAAQRG